MIGMNKNLFYTKVISSALLSGLFKNGHYDAHGFIQWVVQRSINRPTSIASVHHREMLSS
ncbi:MAG: hypothetical protein P4L43_10865 [Syntrophobacteraceae bacterium]|nr:hypothetical protein [Syntrophobacteraceae bacterium]